MPSVHPLEAITPRVESRQVDGVDVVSLSGEFDLSAAENLADAFERTSARSRLVVVDLSGVQFFDSTALGLVLGLRRRLLNIGGRLALVIDGREALRVFQISGLDRIFALSRTVDEAVALVKGNGS
ncbi:MAG TPA: anti-sigma factor antagonist [Gaiellaceae bacterium]